MSGYIILRAGGLIAWASVGQERTSRSSCEAEVRATDECTKEVLSIRLWGKDIGLNNNTCRPLKYTTIIKDELNGAKLLRLMTSYGMKHIDLVRSNAMNP